MNLTRRTLVFAAMTMTATLAFSSVALAVNSQAYNYKTGNQYKGSRATIKGDANTGANSGVIGSAATTGGNYGFYQVGSVEQGQNVNSDCGNGHISQQVVERRRDSSTASLICNLVGGNFGDEAVYSAKFESGEWRGIIDSVLVDGPRDLDYSLSDPFAFGEWVPSAPNDLNLHFGPNGGTDWQRYDGNNWTTNQTSNQVDPAGWNVGPAPSPFAITYT